MAWLKDLRDVMAALEAPAPPPPAAGEMLREAYRANGWEAAVDGLEAYTLARMQTATAETTKAMHDRLQRLCGKIWKGIEP